MLRNSVRYIIFSLVDVNSQAWARPLIPTISSVRELQITAGHSESLFQGVYYSDLQHLLGTFPQDLDPQYLLRSQTGNICLGFGSATFAQDSDPQLLPRIWICNISVGFGSAIFAQNLDWQHLHRIRIHNISIGLGPATFAQNLNLRHFCRIWIRIIFYLKINCTKKNPQHLFRIGIHDISLEF